MDTNDQHHPKWVSKQEMAKRLGINLRTVYSKHKRGEILRREVDGKVLWALSDQPRIIRIGSDPNVRLGVLNEGVGSRVPEGSGSADPKLDPPSFDFDEHIKSLTTYNQSLVRELVEAREENAQLKTQLMYSESQNRALTIRLERAEQRFAQGVWYNPISWLKRLISKFNW